MPIPKKLLPFSFLTLAIICAAYSSGPASSNNSGFTGAPSAGGGSEAVCGTCHNSGDYGTPRLSVRFDGTNATKYRPGQTYTVTVSVQPQSGMPPGYGFQAQFLDASDPILLPAGTLSNPDAVTQLATTDSGRRYAEHKGINSDSLFTFDWTAPEAGTGPVTLYVVGNLVNRAQGSVGDNGSSQPLTLTLTEDLSTGLRTPGILALESAAFPNPTQDEVRVSIDIPHSGEYRFDLYSTDGRVLTSSSSTLVVGPYTTNVALENLPRGTYYYRVSGPATAGQITLLRQ